MKPLMFYRMPARGEKAEELMLASERSTFLFLHIIHFLCDYPCGGVIKGLKQKPERLIKQTFWLEEKEHIDALKQDCPGLWHWEENDLIVDAYDATGEEQYEKQIKGGSRGGKASGEARRAGNTPQPEPTQDAAPPQTLYTDAKDIAELISPVIYERYNGETDQRKLGMLQLISEMLASKVKHGEYQQAQTREALEDLLLEAANAYLHKP